MTPDQIAAWKAHMDAVITREQSPAARALRRFVADRLAATAARSAPAVPAAQPELTERQRLVDSGLIFSVRDQDRADSEADHRARRRRADEATGQRERVWKHLRDTQGLDAADAWLRDAG